MKGPEPCSSGYEYISTTHQSFLYCTLSPAIHFNGSNGTAYTRPSKVQNTTYLSEVSGLHIYLRYQAYIFISGTRPTYLSQVPGLHIYPRYQAYIFIPGIRPTYLSQVPGLSIYFRYLTYLFILCNIPTYFLGYQASLHPHQVKNKRTIIVARNLVYF